jgi:hypothetical protein
MENILVFDNFNKKLEVTAALEMCGLSYFYTTILKQKCPT